MDLFDLTILAVAFAYVVGYVIGAWRASSTLILVELECERCHSDPCVCELDLE